MDDDYIDLLRFPRGMRRTVYIVVGALLLTFGSVLGFFAVLGSLLADG